MLEAAAGCNTGQHTGIDARLAELAERHGVELAYEDVWGRRREASERAVRAVLAALGAGARDDAEVEASLAALERARGEQLLPSARVLRAGTAHGLRIQLPQKLLRDDLEWRIDEDSGHVRSGRLAPGERSFELPDDLAPGYHQLRLLARGHPIGSCALIACPARCYRPQALVEGARWWGGALQLYSLRSRRNWGIGDFGDLRTCIAQWGSAGAAFLGTNPLHALSQAEPARASPYSPSSRRFFNPLYLDVEAIEEFDGMAPPAGLAALRDTLLVDYPRVAAAKRAVLEALHARFAAAGDTPRRRAFEAYCKGRGQALRDFAIFEALQEHYGPQHGPAWQQWPAELRSPSSAAVSRFAEAAAARVGFFEYLQWQCELQLEQARQASRAHGMPIGLYADLSVSVDRGGAEAWAQQDCYALGVSVGAPPDAYSPTGQNWGLPPLVPARLQALAYAPLIETLRANMAYAGALRIDHVMGLARLYWIPDGLEARDGVYVRYPFEDLLGVVALESLRHECLVVGEDLGTVPAGIREALEAAGVHSSRVLLFEKEDAGGYRPPAGYPSLSLASCNTHDLPTVAGFWQGAERAALARALAAEQLDDADPALALHTFLARSPAALVSAQFEDIAGALEQANVPGTVDEQPNWRRKLPLALEDWSRETRFANTVRAFARERPSGRQRTPGIIPRATYRLQLHGGFTFRDATALLPYLDELGISHVYCSPYLRSRAGSKHGYDVIDHRSLDPEIGSEYDYAEFVTALRARSMGQLMDIVPNHMAVGPDNAWWMDVLEKGRTSEYAEFFDIDWQAASTSVEGRILLPVLDDHYGAVLESGGFAVEADGGKHYVRYGKMRFPLAPRSIDNPGSGVDLAALQGRPGDPASWDALHALLEKQAYRLAYWRVASDEINYRRFFDINELAALRMENEACFEATHALIGELLRGGAVDGVRVDHPDGLFDPAGYFSRLRALAGRPAYVVIEKILAHGESIPRGWAVHGLTGYYFATMLNGLYVDRESEAALTRAYGAFTGLAEPFEDIAVRTRRLVVRTAMASELTVLSYRLARIAFADRRTRDYTLNNLREAIGALISSFPVYRTYIAEDISAQDRRHIEHAIADAARRSTAADQSIFGFLREVLLSPAPAKRMFARKLQQFSAPVMAKGVEDTAFYIYNRLTSLNDVGGDPAAYGCSTAELHAVNAGRSLRWPHSMIATSTHDNKRSEDVRARINVISELPAAWRLQLRRWRRLNAAHKRSIDGRAAPNGNDEYLLYQTLLGSWPADGEEAASPVYRQRIASYMLKAMREAKVETSWLQPHADYEAAMQAFIEALLAPGSPFVDELREAVNAITRPAMLASLSKLQIKLTAPGVPDCYQGNELPDFSLVDPDNRRPVDYALRRRLLAEIRELPLEDARALLAVPEDPRAKLYVTWRLLGLRRDHEALFRDGGYVRVDAAGPRAPHLFCFARVLGREASLTIAARLFARLVAEGSSPCAGWEGTRVETPFLPDGARLVDVLTGNVHRIARGGLDMTRICAHAPGAVLYCADVGVSG